MELRFDTAKTYAIALEGGGAKGAYEVGVWQALEEAGVKYNAVSGSSVGALNGAMMAMRDLDTAKRLWENIRFSQVMDVDDTTMQKLFHGDLLGLDFRGLARQVQEIIKGGGVDVGPLRALLKEVVDEERVRNSDVNFYLVTYSITDRKELDLDAKALPKGQLHDMLLASAYFPAFKQEELGGKRYTDGGMQDLLPIHSLISRGYKDIIAIRIYGVGLEKRVKIPPDTHITTIAPNAKLGSVLNFDSERSRREMRLGYFDGQRALYGLAGKTYYIDRQWEEAEAYRRLSDMLLSYCADMGKAVSLRALHEEVFPELAKQAGAGREADYHGVLVNFLEAMGEALSVDPFEIVTEEALLGKIARALQAHGGRMPKLARYWRPEPV